MMPGSGHCCPAVQVGARRLGQARSNVVVCACTCALPAGHRNLYVVEDGALALVQGGALSLAKTGSARGVGVGE